MHPTHIGLLVHKEGLYVQHEVVTLSHSWLHATLEVSYYHYTTKVKQNLKIIHCALNIENWKLVMVLVDSPSCCYRFDIQLNKFSFVLNKKTSKNKHWEWELQMLIAHKRLWIRRWALALVNIRRRRLTRIVWVVCACYKWVGIGVQVSLCLLIIQESPI